jgi:hypothetical protein
MKHTSLALTLLLAACAHGGGTRAATTTPQGPPQADSSQATVKVENLSGVDMDVFVWSNGQRVRLGMVSGGGTQIFPLMASVIKLSPQVRFELRPIGGGAHPRTETITVLLGDQVELTIPPS